MRKSDQFEMILDRVSSIRGLHSYEIIFLTTMVLRKIRHPEEGLVELTAKTMSTMQVRYCKRVLESKETDEEQLLRQASMKAVNKTAEEYGKSEVVMVSVEKCLDQLEVALDEAELPEDIKKNADIVKNTVVYLVDKVRADMEELAEVEMELIAKEVNSEFS